MRARRRAARGRHRAESNGLASSEGRPEIGGLAQPASVVRSGYATLPEWKVGCFRRLCDVVALGEVAPEVRESVEGRFLFHALGDDLEAEGVGEIDGRLDQCARARIAFERGEEAAV